MDTVDQPWRSPDGSGRNETLFVGLAAPRLLGRDAVVDALRSAAALATGWIGVEVTWSTFFAVEEDGNGDRGADVERPGLDWEFLTTKPGTPFVVMLTGVCTALAGHPGHPGHEVASIWARFPRFVAHEGRHVGRMSVSLAVQRWAMYGSGQDLPWFAASAERWVLDTVPALGAATGYAILDRVRPADDQSAWERRGSIPADLAPDRLWGYGWGTVLSPTHLDRIGGPERLAALPDAQVHDLSEGRVWVTLGADPGGVPDESMRALHDLLLPALPPPLVAAVEAVTPGKATPATVAARWRADADQAGGRAGSFGPRGFTLDVLPDLLPFATDVSADMFRFTGVDGDAARRLLEGLPDEALDGRAGPGPTLRRALASAVAHPGAVTLSGHVVGPARDDERITVDEVVVGDPLLEQLGPGDEDAAADRLVRLGVDDALAEPDEVRAAPGGRWTFWWD